MTEQNGIDILCDAAGSDLILGPIFPAATPQAQAQTQVQELPAKRVKLSIDSSPSPPTHVCHICRRVYERADHLTRHLRSHENARPYQCSRCPKRFNRADLLTRHETTHDRDDGGKGRPVIRRSDRAAEACVNCAASKAKCDDQKPCSRCRTKGVDCITSAKRSSAYRTSIDEGHSTVSSSEYSPSQPVQAPDVNKIGDHMEDRKLSDLNHISNGSMDMQNAVVDTPYLQDPLAPNGTMMGGITDDMVYFNPTHNFFQDVDFTSWDLDFDDFTIPQFEISGPSPQSSTTSASRPTRLARDLSRSHAAFKRSPWLWEPKSKDYVGRDKEALTLNEDNIAQSPAYEKLRAANMNPLRLEPILRDRLFAMVLAQHKDSLKIPSFPSLDLLNYLLQTHFIQDEYQTDSWIHMASVDPSTSLPELLAAVISNGATFIAVPAIWQFGLALQEVVRIGMSFKFESSNSFTRDLQCLQAFMLVLDIGLWSGFKRKMEIAESFVQPLMTMLRRAGVFSASADSPSVAPLTTDTPEILAAKWHRFIQRESYKRLVLHLFVHDVQSSVSLQTNPLMSYTELCFSLPASRDLWRAPTMEAWRDAYLRKPRQPSDARLPCVSEVMHSTTLLDTFEEYVDVELCYTTVLNGFWGQIAAYRESVKFYRHSSGSMNNNSRNHSSHRLWLTSQHQELYRDLSEFQTLLCSTPKATPHLTIVAELFMMILHVAPDDLQRFAGKAGEEEARRAATSLEDDWARNREARHALWHAGQVFRNARLLPPASLRGFHAIAVYFASLTLWVYGLLSCTDPHFAHHSHGRHHQDHMLPPNYVLMDGLEDRDTRAFLQLGRGLPGITVGASAQALSTPGMVLNVARNLFRDNYPVRTEPLPPLVESLGNLLRDLGSGASWNSRKPTRIATM
ncbi:hypothetical protein F4778DRAFT_773430 [Xylariomycetidae sp. FL2044]|nr:hypothetical protein F4778DRAFT_773430 [Xylariomycetidae sp. FL2044]